MMNVVPSLLGVIIGALITYFFNISVERKTLKNKVYMDIYEQTIKNIDRSSKSAKDIKSKKISVELETQYKHPSNWTNDLNKIKNNIKSIFKTYQKNINDLIDLNLFLIYHSIPLDKYKDRIKDIRDRTFKIIDIVKQQQELYNSTIKSTGYIEVDDNEWKLIIQNEDKIEECIDKYLNEIVLLSSIIQEEYYTKLLRIK